MATKPFFRRRKVCPFSGDNAPRIDYKDTKLLQRYILSAGKLYRVELLLYQQKNSES